jgi:hypothetical protein
MRTAVSGSCCTGKPSSSCVSAVAGIVTFTNAVVRVELTVERFGVLDHARIESALLVLLQERASLRGEKTAQTLGIAGINGQISEDVSSSLTSPANYVFVYGLKGSPMNDTAVSGPSAGMFPRQGVNRIGSRRRIIRGTAKVEVAVPLT